jgi:hypothetical protein
VIGVNRAAPGLDVPIAVVDLNLTNRREHFDDQLELGERPMRMRLRLTTLQELRIPFGGWLISRMWLASVSASDAMRGADPLMLTRQAQNPPPKSYDREIVDWIREGQAHEYFALPVVTTFTLRMMSDPLPGLPTRQRCR